MYFTIFFFDILNWTIKSPRCIGRGIQNVAFKFSAGPDLVIKSDILINCKKRYLTCGFDIGLFWQCAKDKG